MARIRFRQGIVRSHPNAFQLTAGNTAIKLEAVPLPVVYTFADGPDTDYLYQEATNVPLAWTDLPITNPYYLYFELNLQTGAREFGITTIEPIVTNENLNNRIGSFTQGQMWFDTRSSYEQMTVLRGNRFRRVIRVMAAKVDGTLIVPYSTGSQVGLTGLNPAIDIGTLMYDDEAKTKPLKRFDIRGRGKFITTTTPIFSQYSNLTGFRPEQSMTDGKAIEPIGQYQCVALKGNNQRDIGLARNTLPEFPCIGVSLEDIVTGEVRNFASSGYLIDDNFDIRAPAVDFLLGPGTLIFVGPAGQMTTTVPQNISIQRVAVIVDNYTIFISVQPIVIYGQ